MTAKLDHEVAALKRRLDEALAERDAAEARQAAMAEILEIISSSPGDLAPVFNAMLEKATRLCEAASGILWNYDGTYFRAIAQHGLPFDLVTRSQRESNPIQTESLKRIAAGEDVVRDDDLSKNKGA